LPKISNAESPDMPGEADIAMQRQDVTPVIARSAATKQSSFFAMLENHVWIASLRSQ
jgi:hypothetical protein